MMEYEKVDYDDVVEDIDETTEKVVKKTVHGKATNATPKSIVEKIIGGR